MHFDLFNELTQSLKQAAAIVKGQAEPSRRFALEASGAEAVIEKNGLSQAELTGTQIRPKIDAVE